jgi:vancomycin aglycone glucosyltransferase
VKEMIRRGGEKAGGPATRPSVGTLKKEIVRQIDQIPEIMAGSDLLIGVGLVNGVPTAAEKMRIPYRFMAFYPGIMGPPKGVPFPGRLIWRLGKWATSIVLRGLINRKRKEIGLDPVADVWADWMGENVILASEESLIPVSEKVDFRFTQTGYMFLHSLVPLTEEVEQFLAAGAPPVFIGFGSNPIHKPEGYSRMLAEVARATGQRLIVSKGWGAIGSSGDTANCLFVDEVPYELLFPRVAMVVHHGGTGTMAAAAKAGLPQAVFPFMADQFQNQQELIRLGVAPKTVGFKKLSAEHLTRAIAQGLTDYRYLQKAAEIARPINDHNGTQLTAEVINKIV